MIAAWKRVNQAGWKLTYKNRVNSPKLLKKNAIAESFSKQKPEIPAGELVVYGWDECHLQGDGIYNYLWGDRQ